MSSVFASRRRRSRSRPLLLTGLLLLGACSDEPESTEDQLRAVVSAVEQAVEEGSVKQAAEYLHPDYRDTRHARKREAVASLFGYLRRHRHVHLFTSVRDIELTPTEESAQIAVLVAMAGVPLQSIETVLSVKAELYRFDLGFTRDGADWLILSSRWERVGPEAWIGGD